jgi:NAD(P)H-flavin reductase
MLILQRATAGGYHDNGLLKLDIELTRPIHVQAGQHIWLRIPSTSYTSFAESHPFAIASWGKAQNGKQLITLLIDVREGFTWKLKELFKWESKSLILLKDYFEGRYGQVTIHEGKKRIETSDKMKASNGDLTEIKNLLTSPESNKSQDLTNYIDGFFGLETKAIDLQNMLTWKIKEPVESAYIDGPYGRPIKAEEFGTVILYATGMGIGAQLAIVKHLLECREAGTAKTQRITLLWEVDHVYIGYDKENNKHFIKEDDAQQMVKDLLQQDCDRLSRLRLDPAATFKYRSGWQGAPPDQGYVRSDLCFIIYYANHL